MEKLLSLQELLGEAQQEGRSFGLYAVSRQAKDMEIKEKDLLARMGECLAVMRASVEKGLLGGKTRGGLAGGDARKIAQVRSQAGYKSLAGGVLALAAQNAMAVGECNAGMGKIVAAPTAGASGVLPGVFFALEERWGLTEADLQRGLVAAGVIGMVIASRASLAGAMGGCQAECGSAAAMAAGAAVDMAGGTPDMVGQAAAMAMKNMLGLVCDPVAGLVEVPCIKRNAGAAAQALVASELAIAGIKSVIPVDEVFDAMKAVGNRLPCSLKETSEGGLAMTPTGLFLARQLAGQA